MARLPVLRNKALVVLSGGQDSTTCIFIAKQQGYELHAITFAYGQRHRAEIEAAQTVARMAGVVSHEVVSVPDILRSVSPLTSSAPLEQYADAASMEQIIGDRVELTFVPMRNPFFLTLAVNRAVALGCDTVITGICQEDNANYPDCTERFRSEFQQMARYALNQPELLISAPLMYMSKAETVQLAWRTPGCWEALSYTHTGYDGAYPPTDMNHANVLRAAGFEKAGLPDPRVLRAVKEGLMQLPSTTNYDKERI